MSKIFPTFKALVNNGKLEMEGQIKDSFNSYLKTLSGFVTVSVKPWKEKHERSNEQNRYYFGCVLPLISEHLGYTVEECHEIMKALFIPRLFHIKGLAVAACGTTTTLTTAEMEEYLSNIRSWASRELAVYIPMPNETEY